MIPKIIHYCWFGRNPKPPVIQACIDSWKKFLPGWEIREWNEDTFDVTQIPFSRDAYEAKKWGFVSDFARHKIIYEQGGVYLDTDVLLKNSNLEQLGSYDCWLASDDVRTVATGLGFGAVHGHPICKALMDMYAQASFTTAQVCTDRETPILEALLPEWRCRKSRRTRIIGERICIIGADEYGQFARHLYTNTWKGKEFVDALADEAFLNAEPVSRKQRLRRSVCRFLRHPFFHNTLLRFGGRRVEKLHAFLAYDLIDTGPRYFIKRAWQKLLKHP